MNNRREFLKALGVIPVALSFGVPKAIANNRKKYLVLVELKGGNDGLNTVVPFRDPLYKKLRPNLALSDERIIPITDRLGFHSSLPTFAQLFKDKELAVVQNVGYDSPDFSHFNSIDIWESASRGADDGWLYKVFDANPALSGDLSGVVLGGSSGLFKGADSRFLNIRSLDEFLRASDKLIINKVAEERKNSLLKYIGSNKNMIVDTSVLLREHLLKAKPVSTGFPESSIGQELKNAAELITSGFDLPVIKVSLKGFDTHAEQDEAHLELLKELDDALKAFREELQIQQRWDDVLMMTYSEFGRRVKENGSQGTDHGAANCQFVIGSHCRGGIFGENPKLNNLDGDNLVAEIDFRQLYSSLEKQWFQTKNPVIDKQLYPAIDLLKSA